MSTVGIHEAKTNLSRLLRRVAAGEEIIITRSGKPVAKLVATTPETTQRLGAAVGVFDVPDDFNDPLPAELLKAFE
ncbi:MAG TPA: type II toxin-antitoxin system Phd/YefM family antitoxin [Actinobacteria bacterium]|nr:type II toxin-antitoxin system Phd/YefM family antitoxin [Actinomycetota bacterium]